MPRKPDKKSPATIGVVNRAETKNARASKSDLPQTNPKRPPLQVSLAAHGGGRQKRQPSTRSRDRSVLTNARRREIEQRFTKLAETVVAAECPPCKPLPTQERLKQLFRFDAETGHLYRLSARGGHAAGTRAGLTDPAIHEGYCQVYVDGVPYRTHRLIWKLVTGRDPEGHIDHINGNRSDNRLANLRDVTMLENSRNRHKTTSSVGKLGVSYCARSKRYSVDVSVNKKPHNVGRFRRLADAVEARKIATDALYSVSVVPAVQKRRAA